MRHSTSRDGTDRIVNGISRTTFQAADDTKLMQESTHNLYAGESQQTIEHVHPYGFTAVPQPPTPDGKTAESFLFFGNGNRSHGLAIVTGDRRYRLHPLQPGEVALHDDQTQQLHISRKGIYVSTPFNMAFAARIMRQKDSVAGSADQSSTGATGGSAAGSGASGSSSNSQYGQTAWLPKTPYAYHNIDNKTRTVQHPGTINHQVTDTNDQQTVIHQSVVDQTNGILHSVNQLLHSITLNKLKGIVQSVQNGLHSTTIDPTKGIIQSVQNALHSISLSPGSGIVHSVFNGAVSIALGKTSITQKASQISLDGQTNVQGTLGVSQLLSLLGGLSTGALEVQPDTGSGPGAMAIGGPISASGLGQYANDAAAQAASVPVGGWYINSSSGSLQSRLT
jgi:phage gp45-like